MHFQLFRSSIFNILTGIGSLVLFSYHAQSQVNTVEFGKNRVQYRKFKWQYLQTPNFNTYFYEDGKTTANYVLQIAEKELPAIEQFVEYGLQRRANIVVYNHYNELEQSNIGLGTDWQPTGGSTKLVNNKMVVYFDGDHTHLRRQVRQGIARVLVDNILFGDDLTEIAANHTLLDLPKWLVDGYVDYVAEDWNPELDDQLKSAMLSTKYKSFYQFANDKPELAGHAFWYYIATHYKKENVTYFLYLARVYRNLNSASQKICKMKFKDVLKRFMTDNEELYEADLRGRRDIPKGTVSIVEELKPGRDFVKFTPNPAPRSQTYAVIEYIKGEYCVVLYENMVDRKVLLRTGIRTPENEVNPNYPLLAWDGKGTRLACVYWSKGAVKLFVYDMVARFKRIKQDITQFEQIQDMKYMLNENTLLLSAVRKGQSDIFVYHIDKDNFEQVTNDSYADLDASLVAFPNKQGIIFASNRPDATTRGADTGVAKEHYNIFLADNYNKSEFRQITQLTNLKFGDARRPMQYNTSHFTFVSDESGIANRFAGLFTTKAAGVDSVYVVGEEYMRNPTDHELDSTLKAWGKTEPDSVFTFRITNDSAYVFAITNYLSSLQETKIAGDNGLVSEVRMQGDMKLLYKLKVDEAALRRRNINPRPTDYRKKTIAEAQLAEGTAIELGKAAANDTTVKNNNLFNSGFDLEEEDKVDKKKLDKENEVPLLKRAKLFDYNLKFSADNISANVFSNDILTNRYQLYTGTLPIQLQNNGTFNSLLKASVFDLFEDIRFTGAMRLPLLSNGSGGSVGFGGGGGTSLYVPANQSFFDGSGEWFGRVDYLKHRMDYSLVYYRQTNLGSVNGINNTNKPYEGKLYSNLYQGILKYPLSKVKSLKLAVGFRTDKIVVRAADFDTAALTSPDINKQTFALAKFEFVHDNAILKTMNIMNGVRYKVYADLMTLMTDPKEGSTAKTGRLSFNFGGDFRIYHAIYRNFIWAGRAAADFSWGDQKIIYYLGGVDGWMMPKYTISQPPQDPTYAYQSLAVNMRGFNQNIANGNNALVLNSEFRIPIFATLLNKPINNAFIRNFQAVQFIDLGNAWNGTYNKLSRPQLTYPNPDGSTEVLIRAGGIGPLVGGYGFGVRSTLLGYFMKLDAAWQMNTFFRGKPILYFAIGLDF